MLSNYRKYVNILIHIDSEGCQIVFKNDFRILIIDDSQLIRSVLVSTLENDDTEIRGLSWRRNVETANSGVEGLVKVKSFKPDLILLDIVMPEIDGFEVLQELKKSDETRDIPVIILTSLGDSENEEKGLTLGAVDYIHKPFKEKIALSRIAVHQKISEQMYKIEYESLYDPLTDIFNRRCFDVQSELLWDYCLRDNRSIGVLMIDIDNFKKFNDRYGHLQGDIAIMKIAKALNSAKRRAVDKVFRWGGEEFVVILPGSDLVNSLKIAERFRANIENVETSLEEGDEPLRITASIGAAATYPRKDTSFTTLIREAEKAMHLAKESGKNIVCTMQQQDS